MYFTASESTFSYFEATRAYLERYGKPVAFYSDKASVFRPTTKGEAGVTLVDESEVRLIAAQFVRLFAKANKNEVADIVGEGIDCAVRLGERKLGCRSAERGA